MDLNTENKLKTCRLCLQTSDDVVNVWKTFQDSTIASIVSKHFWFEIDKDDCLMEWLCQTCWLQIKSFHEFYRQIELFQKPYLESSDNVEKDTSEVDVTINTDASDAATKHDLTIVKCEETEIRIETFDFHIKRDDSSEDENIDDEGETENILQNERQCVNKEQKAAHDPAIPQKSELSSSEKFELEAQIREMFSMKCEICSNVQFSSLSKAKYHYRNVHDTQGYITCCSKKFTAREDIKRHIRYHNDPDAHHSDEVNDRIRETFNMKCEICSDVEFSTLAKAKYHYRNVHDTQGYITCCSKKFTSRYEVVKHIRYHNNPDAHRSDEVEDHFREYFNMKCEICSDVEFSTLLTARQHYRKVHKTEGYIRCCSKKFIRPGQIAKHIRFHNNPDLYRCDQCHKSLKDEKSLKIHIDNHIPLDSRKLKCSLCVSSFNTKGELKNHVQQKHTSKTGEKFPCDKCDKNFRSSLLLSCHIRQLHLLAQEYVCEVCARTFKAKTNLLQHIRYEHSSTPPPKVQCDICGVWVKHLKGHRKLHNQTKPLNCPICNKEVRNKHCLSNHIAYVHSEKRFPCTVCDKVFKSSKNLKEHIAIHTGEDLYSCPYCEKKFKSNANMYSHRKKAHLAEWIRDFPQRSKSDNAGKNEKGVAELTK